MSRIEIGHTDSLIGVKYTHMEDIDAARKMDDLLSRPEAGPSIIQDIAKIGSLEKPNRKLSSDFQTTVEKNPSLVQGRTDVVEAISSSITKLREHIPNRQGGTNIDWYEGGDLVRVLTFIGSHDSLEDPEIHTTLQTAQETLANIVLSPEDGLTNTATREFVKIPITPETIAYLTGRGEPGWNLAIKTINKHPEVATTLQKENNTVLLKAKPEYESLLSTIFADAKEEADGDKSLKYQAAKQFVRVLEGAPHGFSEQTTTHVRSYLKKKVDQAITVLKPGTDTFEKTVDNFISHYREIIVRNFMPQKSDAEPEDYPDLSVVEPRIAPINITIPDENGTPLFEVPGHTAAQLLATVERLSETTSPSQQVEEYMGKGSEHVGTMDIVLQTAKNRLVAIVRERISEEKAQAAERKEVKAKIAKRQSDKLREIEDIKAKREREQSMLYDAVAQKNQVRAETIQASEIPKDLVLAEEKAITPPSSPTINKKEPFRPMKYIAQTVGRVFRSSQEQTRQDDSLKAQEPREPLEDVIARIRKNNRES